MVFWLGFMLACVPAFGQGYADELTETMVEDSLVEGMMDENGPGSIVLDLTRTKIGRDFYEAFYQQWNSLPLMMPADMPVDSARGGPARPGPSRGGPKVAAVFNLSEFVVTIEELPSATNTLANLVTISVDNEVLWQQFVPARREIIDEYAVYAVEVVRAYFFDIQTVNRQLGDEDQQGTGIN